MNDSDAALAALREAAARGRHRSALREAVARLASDLEDHEEMSAIREQMADLAPQLE